MRALLNMSSDVPEASIMAHFTVPAAKVSCFHAIRDVASNALFPNGLPARALGQAAHGDAA